MTIPYKDYFALFLIIYTLSGCSSYQKNLDTTETTDIVTDTVTYREYIDNEGKIFIREQTEERKNETTNIKTEIREEKETGNNPVKYYLLFFVLGIGFSVVLFCLYKIKLKRG